MVCSTERSFFLLQLVRFCSGCWTTAVTPRSFLPLPHALLRFDSRSWVTVLRCTFAAHVCRLQLFDYYVLAFVYVYVLACAFVTRLLLIVHFPDFTRTVYRLILRWLRFCRTLLRCALVTVDYRYRARCVYAFVTFVVAFYVCTFHPVDWITFPHVPVTRCCLFCALFVTARCVCSCVC